MNWNWWKMAAFALSLGLWAAIGLTVYLLEHL